GTAGSRPVEGLIDAAPLQGGGIAGSQIRNDDELPNDSHTQPRRGIAKRPGEGGKRSARSDPGIEGVVVAIGIDDEVVVLRKSGRRRRRQPSGRGEVHEVEGAAKGPREKVPGLGAGARDIEHVEGGGNPPNRRNRLPSLYSRTGGLKGRVGDVRPATPEHVGGFQESGVIQLG